MNYLEAIASNRQPEMTGGLLTPSPSHTFQGCQIARREILSGHSPSGRAANEGWTRRQWIEYQKDLGIYRPEFPRTNAGHQWENEGAHWWDKW